MTEIKPDNTLQNTSGTNPIRTLLKIADDGTIPGGKLTIDATVLASIDPKKVIPAILIKAFNNLPIVITNAKANPITDGEDVIITGTSGFRFITSGLATTATLKMVDDNVQALFALTVIGAIPPPTPWKFSDSFPDLPTVVDVSQPDAKPTSPLDAIMMANAQFMVSTFEQTVEGQTLIAGINFRADMSPTGILSVFETIVGGKGILKLQGTINVPSATTITPPLLPGQFPWSPKGTPPGINLMAGLSVDPIEIGSMSFAADLFRVYSAATAEWFGKNDTFKTTVAYTGELDIPSAKTKVGLTALTPPGAGTAKLIGNFADSPLGNFSQLVDIIGISDVLDSFPDAIKNGDLGGLGIQGANVTVGFNKKLDVRGVSITIGMPKLNWEIWPDRFEVDSASVRIDVQNPFDSKTRRLDIQVRGQVVVEGVKIAIVAQKADNFTITASLPDGFNIPLSQLMENFAPGIPPVSDLDINTLNLTVTPGKFFSIMLMMAQKPKPWVIPLGVTTLEFSDVGMFLLQPSGADLSGSFSGTAKIAGVSLTARYDIPGTIIVRGDFPNVSLSDIVSFFLQQKIDVPSGFDISFTQSFVIIQKKGADYKFELGTVIDKIGSLAFVLEKNAAGWGVAAGLQIELDQLDNLSGGVGDSVKAFTSWFPFQTFTLAISTLKDQSFVFPGFQKFNQSSLGKSKITLPAIAQGIQPGFFLYTSTTFTKQNKTLGALIDLLKIPEGTQLDAFVAYLTQKKQFQLGISLTTFLTPVKGENDRVCSGQSGFDNGCLTGTIMAVVGGADEFAFSIIAAIKTVLDGNNLEFDIVLSVVANGVFVSGTLKEEKPLEFGPLQLGGLALELGISFDGLPSFGFAAELMVEDLFDSTLAVLVNTTNPAESMIAGALSDLTLGDVVDKLVGKAEKGLPEPIKKALDEVGIFGTEDGAFSVPKGDEADALEDALNNFDGETIQDDFVKFGKLPSFPSTSEGLMIFNDADHGKWFITEQAGAGSSATVTHWQLAKNKKGDIDVSREAQLYFVPSPAGVNIGTFFYPQGMSISGRIEFLFYNVDVDIDIEVNKGFKVDAKMDKISLGSDNLFSIAAEEGSGGPEVSIATFNQPAEPKQFQKPHFFINGEMTILGSKSGIFVDIDSSGANFKIEGSSLGGVFKGSLEGNFNAKKVDIGGDISVGIKDIDLGKLGTWKIDTGVFAKADIFADIDKGKYGAMFDAGFELGGKTHSIGEVSLDITTGKLKDLAGEFFKKVEAFLKKLFTDPKVWADLAGKVLGWAEDKVRGVLKDVFGLSGKDANDILSAISAFCPIVTAVNVLG